MMPKNHHFTGLAATEPKYRPVAGSVKSKAVVPRAAKTAQRKWVPKNRDMIASVIDAQAKAEGAMDAARELVADAEEKAQIAVNDAALVAASKSEDSHVEEKEPEPMERVVARYLSVDEETVRALGARGTSQVIDTPGLGRLSTAGRPQCEGHTVLQPQVEGAPMWLVTGMAMVCAAPSIVAILTQGAYSLPAFVRGPCLVMSGLLRIGSSPVGESLARWVLRALAPKPRQLSYLDMDRAVRGGRALVSEGTMDNIVQPRLAGIPVAGWVRHLVVRMLMHFARAKRCLTLLGTFTPEGKVRRATHLRNATTVDENPEICLYEECTQEDRRSVVVSPDMATQLALSVHEKGDTRRAMMLKVAGRIANLNVPSELLVDCCEGSVEMASVLQDQRDRERAPVRPMEWQRPVAMVVIGSLTMSCPIFVGWKAALGGVVEEGVRELARNVGVGYLADLTFGYADTITFPAHGTDIFGFHLAVGAIDDVWTRCAIHCTTNHVGQVVAMTTVVLAELAKARELAAKPVQAGAWAMLSKFANLIVVPLLVAFGMYRERHDPTVALGYRSGDHTPILPEKRKSSIKVTKHANFDVVTRREVMQTSLGPHLEGYALPMADVTHSQTVLDGAQHRVGADLPEPKEEMLLVLDDTSTKLARKITPIISGELAEIEEWLAEAPYSLARKEALYRAYLDDSAQITDKDLKCEGHGKRECYVKWNYARVIVSRSDKMKCVFGPAFKAIEREVFMLENFIKHVPHHDRPTYLQLMFNETDRIYETDYTSYEASFHARVMNCCEFRLYEHMLAAYPHIVGLIKRVIGGVNKVKFKWFSMEIPARRMSGEMCTSLGNGWTNYVLVHVMMRDLPVPLTPRTIAEAPLPQVTSVHEGDDGLIASDYRHGFHTERVAALGFVLKLELRHSVLESCFCGLMMSRDHTALADPGKVLVAFGWTHSPQMAGGQHVLRGLLRAKALSLMCEFPQCPILYALARRYVTLTEGTEARFDNSFWEREAMERYKTHGDRCRYLNKIGPSEGARIDFCALFGVSIDDQVALEDYICSAPVGALKHRVIDLIMDRPQARTWADYYRTYVMPSSEARSSDWTLPL